MSLRSSGHWARDSATRSQEGRLRYTDSSRRRDARIDRFICRLQVLPCPRGPGNRIRRRSGGLARSIAAWLGIYEGRRAARHCANSSATQREPHHAAGRRVRQAAAMRQTSATAGRRCTSRHRLDRCQSAFRSERITRCIERRCALTGAQYRQAFAASNAFRRMLLESLLQNPQPRLSNGHRSLFPCGPD